MLTLLSVESLFCLNGSRSRFIQLLLRVEIKYLNFNSVLLLQRFNIGKIIETGWVEKDKIGFTIKVKSELHLSHSTTSPGYHTPKLPCGANKKSLIQTRVNQGGEQAPTH